MNIVVIGAGAVGGYFGGKLANAGIPVTFLVREKRYQQFKERGLQVQSIHGDFTIHPQCVLSAEEIVKPDLVLLAVKNYHVEAVYSDLKILVERGAKILPLLNGVRHMDRLVATFGPEHILGGICYIESTLNEQGDILQKSSMQDIVFGSLTSIDPTFLEEVQTLFQKSGVNVKRSTEIITEMWSKYIFLVTLSGITAASRSPIGSAQKDPVLNTFLREFVEELVNVAKAHNIMLPGDFLEQIIAKIRNLNPDMTSSMHRDLEKGLPLELESLQGTVLEMAKEHALATPCTQAVYALLHPFVQGKSE
jgi:2-dehydropantoate 2-reductase